jgi:hypothetical protein
MDDDGVVTHRYDGGLEWTHLQGGSAAVEAA